MIGNKFLSVAGASEPTDAQFNYVTMLLHGDGTNGAQNNTFLDSSTNNFTITRNGNTTQGSFSPYGSNWSNYFDGTQTLAFPSNTAFAFGTGAYTVEMWVFATGIGSNGYSHFFNAGNATGSFGFAAGSDYSLNIFGYGTGAVITGSANDITKNAWNHIAVCRSSTSSNDTKIYVNGVLKTTGTDATNWTVTTTPAVGGITNLSGYSTLGYISNCRVVKGTAVYTSAFTPSTTPLTAISGTSLLTCQSNRFVDNSSNAFAITVNGTPSVQRFNPFGTSTAYSTATIGGSGYFDGTGDYLSTAYAAASDLSTGSFTVEGWIYPLSWAGYPVMTFWGNSGTGYAQVYISLDVSTGAIYAYAGLDPSPGWDIQLTGGVAPLNSWTHIAFTRNQSTGVAVLYVNGDQIATVSGKTSNLVTPSGSNYIGSRITGQLFTGYISGFRITKSIVYPSAFPPPTTPPTAIANTQVLCNMTNGAIYDNAMMNDLETVGNAQISTSVYKYGTGSLKFDGTGDYLKTRKDVTVGDLGSGDFTLECWARVNTTNAMDLFGTGTWSYYVGSGQSGWAVSQIGSLVAFSYQVNNAWIIAQSFADTTLVINTWYHIAIVRYNGVIKCYLNGTASSTTISNTSNMVSTLTSGLIVGGGSDPNAYNFNGYIDDLRITKGYARYTANFTPPTSALADKGT